MRIGLVCLSLLLSACQERELAVPEVVPDASRPPWVEEAADTAKLTAAVVFARDFAGPLEVGEQAAMVIRLHPQYPEGVMQITITPQQGLEVAGDLGTGHEFDSYSVFESELLLSASEPGFYRLSFLVELMLPDSSRQMRSFQELVQVVERGPGIEKGAVTPGAEVLLPAQEEIIDWGDASP
jgi:hypothetical protein